MSVSFRPFLAGDAVQIALQPSQHITLGLNRPFLSIEDGHDLEEASPTAWTAQAEGGRILACAGLRTLWPASEKTDGHAIAWALLSVNLGPAHVAITRFFRAVVNRDSFTRIEAIVEADIAVQVRWAELVGLKRCAVLRAWGPEGKTHMLLERIRS